MARIGGRAVGVIETRSGQREHGESAMGSATRQRRHSSRASDQEASRLAAIRALIELAEDDEGVDVAAGALLVLGASRDEITAASLDGSH
jgi:hypothetical protein